MSRQQVRLAVAEWVGQAAVPNLNQIFTAHPKRINFQVNAPAGAMTRAAAVVFIADETESRVAIGGAYAGWKRIDYTVDFQIFCHSGEPLAEEAMNAFDVIVDGVKDKLRAGGHRLDQEGSVIWQAAEPDISVTYGEPATNEGGYTEIWAAVRFTVTQMIQA